MPPTEDSATIALQAGRRYALKLEYFELAGAATARLLWSSASQPKQAVPQTQLYAGAGPAPNTPPTVSLTSPAAGLSLAAPATIGFGATASDADGTVSRVDFLAGGTVGRIRHDRALCVQLGRRGRRDVQRVGACDGQLGRHDRVPAADDHGHRRLGAAASSAASTAASATPSASWRLGRPLCVDHGIGRRLVHAGRTVPDARPRESRREAGSDRAGRRRHVPG